MITCKELPIPFSRKASLIEDGIPQELKLYSGRFGPGANRKFTNFASGYCSRAEIFVILGFCFRALKIFA